MFIIDCQKIQWTVDTNSIQIEMALKYLQIILPNILITFRETISTNMKILQACYSTSRQLQVDNSSWPWKLFLQWSRNDLKIFWRLCLVYVTVTALTTNCLVLAANVKVSSRAARNCESESETSVLASPLPPSPVTQSLVITALSLYLTGNKPL